MYKPTSFRALVAPPSNTRVILLSVGVGILVGLCVSAYRYALGLIERVCLSLYQAAGTGWLNLAILILLLAGLVCATGLLLGCCPMIGGSGIPQLKGLLGGHLHYPWFSTLVAKFAGGCLCIMGGLSLGREGPSIQLGACVADGVAERLAHTRQERRLLIACGAGAGLAGAFNAPLAGVIFTLEEIFKYFSPLILLTSMAAATAADFVSRCLFGDTPVFHFEITRNMPLESYWTLILLGILLGVAGALYNRALLAAQAGSKRLGNRYARLSVAFGFALLFGLSFPAVLCGGHEIIELLKPETAMALLGMLFLFKFAFSVISFGSGAPGGIFFPLLVMGATIGAMFGRVAIDLFGVSEDVFVNYVILAMAGFFTAIVRAPITGVVLILEMTESFNHVLSLVVVSIVAYVVAEALHSKPVYDALLESLLRGCGQPPPPPTATKVTFEVVVQHDSLLESAFLREAALPPHCLVLTVRREQLEIVPCGDTKLCAGDRLVLLCDQQYEPQVREVVELRAAEQLIQ